MDHSKAHTRVTFALRYCVKVGYGSLRSCIECEVAFEPSMVVVVTFLGFADGQTGCCGSGAFGHGGLFEIGQKDKQEER